MPEKFAPRVKSAEFEGIVSPELGAKIATFDVIQSLEISPDVTSLFNGQTQRYQVFASYAGAPEPQDITDQANWSSDNTNVLVPDSDKGSFKAISVGTATITASHTNTVNDKITVTKNITVVQVFLDRIEIRPDTSTITVGNTRDYIVWGINTDQSEYKIDLISNLVMSVSDPDKAYFKKNVNNNTYVLTTVKAGDVTLNAVYLEPANPPMDPEFHRDSVPLTINPK